MTEQEIIIKIKAILNEIGEEENLSLLSEDTVQIEEYIKATLPDAVNLVQMNSPIRCVNKKSGPENNDITPNENGLCTIPVPDDFVSLIAVKLASWKRSCIVAFGINSEEYKRQCNPFTVAGSYKPMCILGYDNAGNRVLELYSSKSKTSIEMFVYEAKYSSGNGIDIDINDPIAQSICFMAASLVYSIFENKEMAQEMKTLAVNLIPK